MHTFEGVTKLPIKSLCLGKVFQCHGHIRIQKYDTYQFFQ